MNRKKNNEGEQIKSLLIAVAKTKLQRPMLAEAIRRILTYTDMVCIWQVEQCTLAEFCAYVARDVVAHVDYYYISIIVLRFIESH